MKKYISEALGTMILVLFGCGVAVFSNGNFIATACAFGLSVIAASYIIGGVSGCHINPAITLGSWLSGRTSGKDAIGYVVGQLVGAFVGALVLFVIVKTLYPSEFFDGIKHMDPKPNLVGANLLAPFETGTVKAFGALLAEIVGTFVFVLVALAITDEKKGNGKIAGVVIGVTLILIHFMLIPITGCSVNPARSFGPAIFYGGKALGQLWIFVLGPIVGATLSAVVWGCYSESSVFQKFNAFGAWTKAAAADVKAKADAAAAQKPETPQE